jgi:hypothetical protein
MRLTELNRVLREHLGMEISAIRRNPSTKTVSVEVVVMTTEESVVRQGGREYIRGKCRGGEIVVCNDDARMMVFQNR